MDRASKHSAIFVAAYIATAVINYAFGVTLSWFFDIRQFGILGVAQSLLLLVALTVGSGFTWTAAHDFASYGLTDTTRRRFRMGLISNALLAVLLSISLWVGFKAGWIPLGKSYSVVVPLIGITTILLSIRGVLNGAARGLYHFTPVSINLVGEVVIKAAFGLIFVYLGLGVTGVMLGFVIGAGLSLVHSLLIVRPAKLWQGKGWFDSQVLVDTMPLFVGLVGIALLMNLDVLGLKILAPIASSDAQAGIYQAAAILARTPVYIAQALTLVLFSYAASATRKNGLHQEETEIDHRQAYIRTALKTWLRLIFPATLIFFLAPRQVLDLFFPAEYQTAAVVLRITAVGGGLLALATLLTGVFQALGERKIPARAAGIAALIQILVLVWLVPGYGAVGAALSLVTAGLSALLRMLPLLLPVLKEMVVSKRAGPGKFSGWIITNILPHLSLTAVLLVFPKDRFEMTVIMFGLAGLIYLGVMGILRSKSDDSNKRSAVQAINHFVQVLLGG